MIISWNTTQACNIQCLHCYRDAGKQAEGELNTEQGKELLREIAKAGFKIMIFSGGEPLLRDDIYELIQYAGALGMRPVLGTNGILITEEVARRLKDAGLATAGISLDSMDKKQHDYFRQCDGAWESTLRGMAACRSVGLPFQIHTTVSNWNAKEVTHITDLAIEQGAVAHHVFFLVPAGRGKDIEDTSLRTQEYEEVLNQILEKQQEVGSRLEIKPTCAPQFMRIAKEKGIVMRYTKGCLAGTSYCVILPNGDVHPCPYLPLTIGNVKAIPFSVLWEENPVFQELRKNELEGSCGRCGYQDICGGCRARAYYYSDGNMMAEEPWCSWGQNL